MTSLPVATSFLQSESFIYVLYIIAFSLFIQGLRGAIGVPVAGRLWLRLGLEHLEHAVGHEKATDDVDRPEGDRDHQNHLVEGVVAGQADDQKATEQHDPVDRVGA